MKLENQVVHSRETSEDDAGSRNDRQMCGLRGVRGIRGWGAGLGLEYPQYAELTAWSVTGHCKTVTFSWGAFSSQGGMLQCVQTCLVVTACLGSG